MDTTPEPVETDAIERVQSLLASIPDADPAAAVEPLSEVADLLETLLEGEGTR